MGGWCNGVWVWGDFGIPHNPSNNTVIPAVFSSVVVRDQHIVVVADPSSNNIFSEELLQLQQAVQSVSIDFNRTDIVKWQAELEGVFSVKSCYNIINANRILYGPLGEFDKALTIVWKMDVLMKIRAFGWRSFIYRLPMRGALTKRGIISFSNSSCVYCCIREETSVHLLLTCHNADLVWRDIAKWIGFDNYKARDLKESFLKW
ncbi:uncharacterized protein LOC131596961 [Vicia villosa]|uniref:uncharacterized protein LOC131596961 n=1 Tax=Vicia villosa TaxID=3911 RepID=UPI00273AB928|nr:uncharacterized protein LOC131596961 [Vicia villosa]